MARMTREQRIQRSAVKAADIARSGKAVVDVNRLSSRTLEEIIRQETRNTPLSRKAATELARRGPGKR